LIPQYPDPITATLFDGSPILELIASRLLKLLRQGLTAARAESRCGRQYGAAGDAQLFAGRGLGHRFCRRRLLRSGGGTFRHRRWFDRRWRLTIWRRRLLSARRCRLIRRRTRVVVTGRRRIPLRWSGPLRWSIPWGGWWLIRRRNRRSPVALRRSASCIGERPRSKNAETIAKPHRRNRIL